MKLRKFQLSCPVFWGYNKYIDIEKYNNVVDIIKDILDSCESFFKSNNLIDMYEFFKSIKKSYHIHGINFNILHQSKEEEVFYVCRHDNCTNPMDITFQQR